jgi:sigma-B regulation protein RsbU (phosphoserine phosphatase)
MNPEAATEAFYDALLDDDPEELYDRAPCGYLTTTSDGTIVKANATFLALTGYTREQLVGQRSFSDLLNAGGRIYHETHFAPMLQMQGTVREVAFDLVRTDGSRLPVLVNAVLETAPDGAPRLIRVAVFDATHRREYERELLRAKQRAERSEAHAQELARTLQATLIPPSPPNLPGLDVSASYRPAGDGEEVGGDFYDVFQIGPDDWVVALGDVCGKGVQAAVLTALVRYTLRALTVQERAPSVVLAALNQVLLDYGSDRFCTVVLVRLRRDDHGWVATISAGGHPLPLHVGRDATAREVGQAGSLVGALTKVRMSDTELRLTPGDVLTMYTDGVTEGRRRGSEFYGEDRLRDVVVRYRDAHYPAEDIVADVLDFQQGTARDDIAVVVVRVPAPDPTDLPLTPLPPDRTEPPS